VKRGGKKLWQKGNKKKKLKIKILAHELLASTLSYLMLAPWWYTNHSNHFSRTTPMLSLVVICLSSHYRSSYYSIINWCLHGYSLDMSKPDLFLSTGATPSLSCMSSFSTRSLLVWPQIYRSMCISATFNCWTWHLLVYQYSALYNIADRIALL
jgi:hypothetical protein